MSLAEKPNKPMRRWLESLPTSQAKANLAVPFHRIRRLLKHPIATIFQQQRSSRRALIYGIPSKGRTIKFNALADKLRHVLAEEEDVKIS
ncbi:hypothetical protein G5I_01877 [Acromyrmex echinatior]|uniref:Uncharacterized protein n=1 Tax=Acromyrmex echinatior TaxID=103372 RepID=F4W8U0_ACREC|nr:hypothetical protein G5I_01877 [Acromyrmex echinatior]